MGRGEKATRQVLRVQAAVATVLCPVVGIALIVIGVTRASSGAADGNSALGFLILVAVLLFGGAFVCWHRFRMLSRADGGSRDDK
ncbi:hypothetical protein DEJ23_12325 [Curtobacterium sp. MCSS17_008]|uniref:hypothetical protein n=1 Tax=Curtobacterium sp. MCSS17_008 TaxID=2175647 RepID=UPI000DAA980C|nr:hypothetical protein [Curtobacterium sp. MCSS17_008]PZF55273.1 hypothetical protein DEJ23_12325 [Curtobacterium sp. MCSS17_008]